ncbi:MFS transporter [Photorhabdus luminescens]|uniref:MFS transporter n=1 Tax=Photorhabdus luminescens TaxID=29488 RepID=UPI00223FD8BA|nr:MFS transporter [Photorhabdus luminescens]MCW7762559.1 MFS transporter [Photorhabdus luminescens subsp. venezuelensis]
MFLVARSLGLLADQVALLAIPVAIYVLTNDVTWSGLALIIQWLPRIIALPILGGLVDRWNLRNQYLLIDIIRSLVSLILVWIDNAHALMVIAGILSLLNGYAFIILEYSIATRMDSDKLVQNQSWLQVIENSTRVAGPALGGFFLTIGFIELAMLSCSVLFVLAAFMTYLSFPKQIKDQSSFVVSKNKLGLLRSFKIVLASKPLLRLTGITMGTNFIEGVMAALLPAIILSHYGRGEEVVGYLHGVSALLVIIFMAVISGYVRSWDLTVVALWAVGLSAGAVLLMAQSQSFVFFGILYVFFILMRSLFVLYLRTERVKYIPVANLGQVLGVMIAMILSTFPLSGAFIVLISNRLESNAILICSVFVASIIYLISYLLTLYPDKETVKIEKID